MVRATEARKNDADAISHAASWCSIASTTWPTSDVGGIASAPSTTSTAPLANDAADHGSHPVPTGEG